MLLLMFSCNSVGITFELKTDFGFIKRALFKLNSVERRRLLFKPTIYIP